jgi:hypothetical protein
VSIEQLTKLRQRQHDLQAAWYRQLLTLAAAGLALLVGLAPPAEGIGKLLLASTWVCLGVGICAGSAATYLEVSLARALADSLRAELLRPLREGKGLALDAPVVATPHVFFSWSGPVMVVSLLLAVCCLVGYAVLATLAA